MFTDFALGANVLVTELGGVQLCDFGVAGTLETKLDKRSTFTGTFHWMAPELFDSKLSYGREVDIWAFGCMVYEIATGFPPNTDTGIPYNHAGSRSEIPLPRLEGGSYSEDLRGIVAYCLEELPSLRPTIDQVQKHPYIWNSNSRYPTSSLSYLVRAFKMWEDHVGSRESLFMPGGVQGLAKDSLSMANDEWNFSTTATFDQEVSKQSTAQDVYDAYGTTVELQDIVSEETSRPKAQNPSRRRPPPEALKRLPAPLEKIFDPNTLSTYDDNSRNHYGRPLPPPTSDLPLRDENSQTSIKDTMIDLGAHGFNTGLSKFPEMETIKANKLGGSQEVSVDEYNPTLHNFSHPALSDPVDVNHNRRTQGWKFPAMELPVSADPAISQFPASYDLPRQISTGGSDGRPPLIHHPTRPIGTASRSSLIHSRQASLNGLSIRESLIDLDMSLPEVAASSARSLTVNSDTGSTSSDQIASGHHLELGKHASLYAPPLPEALSEALSEATTEHESYLTEEYNGAPGLLEENSEHDIGRASTLSDSDTVFPALVISTDPKNPGIRPLPSTVQEYLTHSANQLCDFSHIPELPSPPSQKALSGLATHDELKEELNRMLSSMTSQLKAFHDVYASPQFVHRKGHVTPRRQQE